MEVNPLYHKIKNSKESTIVCQGGQDSGKTYAILQCIFMWCLEHNDIIASVVARTIPNLKRGALRHALRIINSTPEIKERIVSYNKTDRIILWNTGSVTEFISIEDEQEAKGSKRNILFINEANSEDYETVIQLHRRSTLPPFFKRIYDYNPSATFWAHEKMIGKPDVRLIISDHRNNRFLTKFQHEEIESIPDKEAWRVYARGYTGQLKGLIYKSWIDTPNKPEHIDETIWAIDYGYGNKETSGKTAVIRIDYVKPYTLYLKECCYLSGGVDGGIDQHTIKSVLELNGWVNGQPYYSELDPNMILAQRKIGMSIRQAIKGAGSEFNGIMKIKKFQVFYDSNESPNLHWERTHAKWFMVGDEVSKIVENTMVYHLLAATRYGVYTHFQSM